MTQSLMGLDHKVHIILNKVCTTMSLRAHAHLQKDVWETLLSLASGGPVHEGARLCPFLRITLLEPVESHPPKGFTEVSACLLDMGVDPQLPVNLLGFCSFHRIYTMCVPVKQSVVAPTLQEAFGDLEAARNEVHFLYLKNLNVNSCLHVLCFR